MIDGFTTLTKYFVKEVGLHVEMTEKEIATELEIPQSTVHRLLQSAMLKLKQKIKQESQLNE